MYNVFLAILCVILFGTAVAFALAYFRFRKVAKSLEQDNLEYVEALKEGHRAVELALKYEDFYNATVGDIGEIVDSLTNLLQKRQMLSDDPDVQNLVRLLAIAHDTLLRYINAKSPTEDGGNSGKAN